MNIVVCIKQILDPEIHPRDFQVDFNLRKAVQGAAALVVNPYDENAVEVALQLKAKVIVAINVDPEAPIFKVANLGVVEDYRNVLPTLIAQLTNTTTLNSFKKNHKGPITGLELGFETSFNFAGIQKPLKILSFHF